jgi:twitching motility protein PilI
MAKKARVNLRVFQQELAARLLAKTAAQVGAARLGLVSGGQNWLVRLGDASEVLTVPPLVHVPLTQPWFLGLANIRGNLFSVVDFAGFNGHEATPAGLSTRLLLFGQRFSELRAALLVQQVLGLRSLSEMQSSERKQGERDWVGQSWRDATGREWKELDLVRLAQNQRFLTVGLL